MSRGYTHPILFVWIGIRHFPHLPLAVSKMPRQTKNRFEAQSLCLFRHVVVVDLQEFLGMGDLTKPASEPSCSLGPFDVNTASTWPQSQQFIEYMYLVQASLQIQTFEIFWRKRISTPSKPCTDLGPEMQSEPNKRYEGHVTKGFFKRAMLWINGFANASVKAFLPKWRLFRPDLKGWRRHDECRQPNTETVGFAVIIGCMYQNSKDKANVCYRTSLPGRS